MTALTRAIRPTDIVLTVLLSGLGVVLMIANMRNHGGHTRVDSHTWLMVPVFLLATLPVLFRRVNLMAAILVSAAAIGAHDAIFGWVVRCGAGLPLAGVLAYSAGRLLADRRQSMVAVALTIGVQALVLVRDSAAGIGILPVTAGIGIAAWGAGWYVRSLVARRSAPTPTAAPRATATV